MKWERKNKILSCDESLNHSQTRNKNNLNKNGKMNTVVLPNHENKKSTFISLFQVVILKLPPFLWIAIVKTTFLKRYQRSKDTKNVWAQIWASKKTFHEIVTHLKSETDELMSIEFLNYLWRKRYCRRWPTNYKAPVPMSSEEKMQSNVKIVLNSLQTNTLSGLELLLRRVTEIKNKRCTLVKRNKQSKKKKIKFFLAINLYIIFKQEQQS